MNSLYILLLLRFQEKNKRHLPHHDIIQGLVYIFKYYARFLSAKNPMGI